MPINTSQKPVDTLPASFYNVSDNDKDIRLSKDKLLTHREDGSAKLAGREVRYLAYSAGRPTAAHVPSAHVFGLEENRHGLREAFQKAADEKLAQIMQAFEKGLESSSTPHQQKAMVSDSISKEIVAAKRSILQQLDKDLRIKKDDSGMLMAKEKDITGKKFVKAVNNFTSAVNNALSRTQTIAKHNKIDTIPQGGAQAQASGGSPTPSVSEGTSSDSEAANGKKELVYTKVRFKKPHKRAAAQEKPIGTDKDIYAQVDFRATEVERMKIDSQAKAKERTPSPAPDDSDSEDFDDWTGNLTPEQFRAKHNIPSEGAQKKHELPPLPKPDSK